MLTRGDTVSAGILLQETVLVFCLPTYPQHLYAALLLLSSIITPRPQNTSLDLVAGGPEVCIDADGIFLNHSRMMSQRYQAYCMSLRQKSKAGDGTPVWVPVKLGIVALCAFSLLFSLSYRRLQAVSADGRVVVKARASAVSGVLFTGSRQRTYTDTRRLDHQTLPRNHSARLKDAGPQSQRWAVCTTVFAPSEAILQMVALQGWSVVIVGDVNAANFNVTAPNLVYLDASAQQRLESFTGLVDLLPWKHFGRKNLGYLYAVSRGAELIWDFDDDNILKPDVAPVMPSSNVFHVATGCPVFNPYPLMGGPSAADPRLPPEWPRGFPLDLLHKQCNVTLTPGDATQVAVVQSLADHDPDVDGIFRLTRGVPMHFDPSSKRTLVVPPNVMTPWNAQVGNWPWMAAAVAFCDKNCLMYGLVAGCGSLCCSQEHSWTQ